MEIEVLRSNEFNTGHLTIMFPGETIEIKRGRFIKEGFSHPLFTEKESFFSKIYCLEYKKKHVYFLNYFGRNESPAKGIHIGLNNWENNKFLWMQNKHWLQKEESIRYIVNVLFLIIGICISIISIYK
ncbi:hypothetical protein [Flavobacterium crassostreae]|uniref:Uncharacterized protein n=1 Tax=Flavobacterium crassostreae TaxID=1763534 RepID=A0A1B9DZM4_9FLAO|nr:hypothetical protein [Flavobacterium crassostreae]OCB75152.1 hypothetical protein LPBF_08820 [Flavobacterium crassostreae]